uniref:Uncharacterized protein n=1 Tax=Avena sativa TaxID=4498 RepID=A0ACD5ZDI8_AVESA
MAQVHLFLMVLPIVSFVVSSSVTTGYYEHPRRLLEHIGVPSFNSTSKVTHRGSKLRASSHQEVDEIDHVCGYQSSVATYYGVIATMDVYTFQNLKESERILAQIWVVDDTEQTQLTSGWEVNPSRYGDSKTHFFVDWTINEKDGCPNLLCAGFVPVNSSTITPGDILEPSSGQSRITLKIFKSKEDGNWWLHFGTDTKNLKPVGYWPKGIIIKLLDHASFIQWAGVTFSYNGEISPPMGNGQWPRSSSAASFRNVQYVDVNGHGYDPSWDSLHAVETHRECYRTGVFRMEVEGNMFYYGGPGGCTS